MQRFEEKWVIWSEKCWILTSESSVIEQVQYENAPTHLMALYACQHIIILGIHNSALHFKGDAEMLLSSERKVE